MGKRDRHMSMGSPLMTLSDEPIWPARRILVEPKKSEPVRVHMYQPPAPPETLWAWVWRILNTDVRELWRKHVRRR